MSVRVLSCSYLRDQYCIYYVATYYIRIYTYVPDSYTYIRIWIGKHLGLRTILYVPRVCIPTAVRPIILSSAVALFI